MKVCRKCNIELAVNYKNLRLMWAKDNIINGQEDKKKAIKYKYR